MLPGVQTNPEAHRPEQWGVVSAGLSPYEPARQGVHAVELFCKENEPAGQAVQFTGPPLTDQLLTSDTDWVIEGPKYPAEHTHVYDVAPGAYTGSTELG